MFETSVRYNKLWKILIDKKMSKSDLRKALDIAPSTMTKLRRDQVVSMDILIRICAYLDCNIGDVCDIVKTRDDANVVGAGEADDKK